MKQFHETVYESLSLIDPFYTRGSSLQEEILFVCLLYVITFSFALIEGIFYKNSDSFSKDWSLTFQIRDKYA